MEGCESCTLSLSMDGHRSHVSIFLLKKVITKKRIIKDMQFPLLPGVKWKKIMENGIKNKKKLSKSSSFSFSPSLASLYLFEQCLRLCVMGTSSVCLPLQD